MGVKGLWRLLLPIGRRISIETLEGKRLAIDASIWLTQFVKALRDKETGAVQASAHLIGFFRRLCRLRYHGIRPILVFDGATPEIKRRELQQRRRRREQFARLGDSAVQRLAKKILADKLKQASLSKKAPSKSLAEGFDPGDQEKKMPAVTATESNEEKESVDAAAELVDLSAELKDAIEPAENDWDSALDVTAAVGEDASGNDSDSSDGDGETKETDLTYLARLPANQRKDAVEKAQRKQRLRSRKEFMPAAGDPQQFSSVQLTNFLRSSRLNQSIAKIAIASTAADSLGVAGEGISSDTNTRIELLREDWSADSSDIEGVTPARPTAALRPAALLRKRRPNEDSSDEEEWGGDNEVRVSRGERLVIDDETSEDDQTATSDDDKPEGFVVTSTLNARSAKSVPMTQADMQQYQQRAALVDRRTTDASRESEQKAFGPNESSGKGLRSITHSAVDLTTGVSSSSEPNTQQNRANVATGAIHADSEDCLLIQSDMARAQELSDHALATALQEIEDSNVGQADGVASELLGIDKPFNSLNHSLPEESCSDDSDDDGDDEDEVDWEDGDGAVQTFQDNTAEKSVASDDDVNSVARLYSTSDLPPRAMTGSGSSSLVAGEDPHSSNQAALALDRAQTTAASLANWAGRAFQRAIKEVNHTAANRRKEGIPDIGGSIDQLSSIQKGSATEEETDATLLTQELINNTASSSASSKDDTTAGASMNAINDFDPTSIRTTEFVNLPDEDTVKLWAEERNRRERDIDTVTDEMKDEVIRLLQLFGIPYIEAPGEAEAQCCFLERLGLVDGIVTEDSDVFVFGGQTVYRNIFDEQKYAEVYIAADAEREMSLGRNEMITLAMLLGGDYTEGVKGVGIVNAMEVLETFSVSGCVKDGLVRFRKWLDGFDFATESAPSTASSQKEAAFHAKHMSARSRWTTPEGFPSDHVIQAYLGPVVDNSEKSFTWSVPDVENLIAFCSRNIGWRPEDTRRLLDPVVGKVQDGFRQTRIDSFMRYEDSIKFADVRSKRLRDVLGLSGDKDDSGTRQTGKRLKHR